MTEGRYRTSEGAWLRFVALFSLPPLGAAGGVLSGYFEGTVYSFVVVFSLIGFPTLLAGALFVAVSLDDSKAVKKQAIAAMTVLLFIYGGSAFFVMGPAFVAALDSVIKP